MFLTTFGDSTELNRKKSFLYFISFQKFICFQKHIKRIFVFYLILLYGEEHKYTATNQNAVKLILFAVFWAKKSFFSVFDF